jgi:putative transcriptional regulator
MSKMGQELLAALKEALDDAEGKIVLRTTKLKVSPVCSAISVEEIRDTRQKLGMSQGMFAIAIGVSRKTVESWEAGRYRPDGAARRLISIMRADPAFPEKYGIINRS